jgi:hypothetical protein
MDERVDIRCLFLGPKRLVDHGAGPTVGNLTASAQPKQTYPAVRDLVTQDGKIICAESCSRQGCGEDHRNMPVNTLNDIGKYS